MLLTRDEQRAIDSAYYHLQGLKFDMVLDKLAVQMGVEEREQKQLDTLLREQRVSRRQEVAQFMASRPTVRRPVKRPSHRYETKARPDARVIQDYYELKKKLPLAARKQLENEYNLTDYGQEQQLIDKYVRLYRL